MSELLQIHPADNVAVALRDFLAGETVKLAGGGGSSPSPTTSGAATRSRWSILPPAKR